MPIKCPFCFNTIPQSLINQTNKKKYQLRVIDTKALHVRKGPSTDHDIIGHLNSGDQVLPIDDKDSWYKIPFSGQVGWISAEYTITADRSADEMPEQTSSKPGKINFVKGRPHNYNSAKTIKLRKYINDEFGQGRARNYLQCTEYSCYRIKLAGHTIEWPVKTGRHGGRWAAIFQETKYNVSDKPMEGAAMSFTNIQPYGHVAYVEKVDPDGSIFISEANWPKDGIYNERTISLKLQQQYGAKFIKFI
jgi:surface antigen